ncbi:MAG: hypothetical protein RL095_3311 [Verrucomicrobiota bacterium]|jgi:sugar phosphate isomerase/epimerase
MIPRIISLAAGLATASFSLSVLASEADLVAGTESGRPLLWEGRKDLWMAEAGTISCDVRGKPLPHNEFLVTRKDFGDFRLEAEVNLEAQSGFANGGIQFRSQRLPGSPEMRGYQADAGPGYWGNLYDESYRNRNLAEAKPELRLAHQRAGWNKISIECIGKRSRIWLNDILTADFTESDPAVPQTGRIGLQIHGGGGLKISYRNIKLEQISASDLPKDVYQHGFAIGVQAWCFHRFSAHEAIERTAQTGARCIELFKGQQLSRDDKGQVGPEMTETQIQALLAQLAKHKVKAAGMYCDIPKDEAQARKLFSVAKKLGLYNLVTESVESIDTAEKMAREFDLHVAFHNHARNGNPGYKNWDPHFILSLVKERDSRIGACADIGHWASSGIKPLDALSILKGRILSLHLKDRAVIGRPSEDIAGGTGVLDFAAVLRELKSQGFKGQISVEYENNWVNNVPDIAQYVGFVRGAGASLNEGDIRKQEK